MFKAFCDDPQRQCLHTSYRCVAVFAIGHDAR